MKLRNKEQMNELWSELSSDCVRGDIKYVREFLNKYPDTDIAYDNGAFFGLAMVLEEPEILELLIDFYKKTQMQALTNSEEYRLAKERLLDILYEQGNWSNTTSQAKIVVNRYLNEQDFDLADFGITESRSEGDESEEEINMASTHGSAHDSDPHSDHHFLPLTEENLKKLDIINSMSISEKSVGIAGNKVVPTGADSLPDQAVSPEKAVIADSESEERRDTGHAEENAHIIALTPNHPPETTSAARSSAAVSSEMMISGADTWPDHNSANTES